MKNVLTKALARAKEKGFGVEDTVDLIIDYLEIANEISPVRRESSPEPPPIVVASGRPAAGNLEISGKGTVDINRTVIPRKQPWKTDDLHSLISKEDLSFTVRPDGWEEDLDFRFSLVKDPNGMKGVGVVWQAVKDPQFKQNYFFSVDEQPDVRVAIDEVKKSVNAALRKRDKPIQNSTIPLRSYPSDIASMAGFVASV